MQHDFAKQQTQPLMVSSDFYMSHNSLKCQTRETLFLNKLSQPCLQHYAGVFTGSSFVPSYMRCGLKAWIRAQNASPDRHDDVKSTM